MRVKQIWELFPLPSHLRLVYDRITSSRLTTIYFLFSLAHCVIQIGLQIQAFTTNAEAAEFLSSIVEQTDVKYSGFPVLGDDLRVCDTVPSSISVETCTVVWSGAANTQPQFNLEAPPAGSSSVFISSFTASLTTKPAAASTVPATSTILASTSSSILPSSSSSSSYTSALSLTSSRPVSTRASSTFALPTQSAGVHHDSHEDDDEDDNEHGREYANRRSLSSHHNNTTSLLAALEMNGNWTIELNGMGHDHDTANLSPTCLASLTWPIFKLKNTKREDIVFILFNAWLFGMSLVAILNTSIPHIIASLLTHVLAAIWASFQIDHTREFRSNFNRLITSGACRSTNALLSDYWSARSQAEMASLVLNVIALVSSAVLTWRLVKLFGWQTFKRVGASRKINRVYKLVLVFSIILQLSLFFMLVSMGLWIDQLFHGAIGCMASHRRSYQALSVLTIALTLPWLATGWIASRKELRWPMHVFLFMTTGCLAIWFAMFMSASFRVTINQWVFFSIMQGSGVVLTVLSLVFGVISRCNFGLGLHQYLEAEEPLPADFKTAYPGDMEKVPFPSNNAVPTFSVAFGSGMDVPPPRRMFGGVGVGSGPRQPAPAYTRNSGDSYSAFAPLVRTSTHSTSLSHSDEKDRHSGRWVIE